MKATDALISLIAVESEMKLYNDFAVEVCVNIHIFRKSDVLSSYILYLLLSFAWS